MATYTTSDFLTSVRQRGSIPTTTNTNNVNSTTNLLNLATEELHITLLPLIMSVRAEYYVTSKSYTITASQAAYAISPRASGMVLRDVQIIEGTSIRSLPEIPTESLSTTSTGSVEGYYLEHENVILYPTPATTTGTLKLRFYIRPSRLAATTDCAQITAINTGTSTVTVASIPSTWVAGNDIDFISATSPYQCRAIDQDIASINGSDIVFTSLPTGLAVGDWVALAEYSPIPQVPFEFLPVLAQMTVVKALEALGDNEGTARATKDLTRLQNNALMLVTPRNQGEPQRVVPTRWR
jgi:hypothetical protein